jgi:hypothetical protein
VGHHQVETRISEKTDILQCGHQAWGTRSRVTMFVKECSCIYSYIMGVGNTQEKFVTGFETLCICVQLDVTYCSYFI